MHYKGTQLLWLPLCSASDMKAIGVRSILDLRRMDRPCKKRGKVMDQVRLAGRYTLQVRTLCTLPSPSNLTCAALL